MSDDALTADRVRTALSGRAVREIRMFGGLSFMVNDKLAVNVRGDGGLLIRVDPADADELLRHDGVEPAEMGPARRPMGRGWLTVPASVLDDDAVRFWTGVACAFNAKATGS